MTHVQIIISSVRPSRIGDQIARWVVEIAAHVDGLTFELVDLKDWHLPLDDEPDQPKNGGYLQSHTMSWSNKVKGAGAFVFVTPQYNWGYPASLKNALDHLYYEWVDKPAVIVSYGHRGGVKAADQLKQVLIGLHMQPAQTMPALLLTHDMLDHHGRLRDPAASFGDHKDEILQALGELASTPQPA